METLGSETLKLSSTERMELGRSLRKDVPRSAHAGWQPIANRRDPIDILEESNAGRVAHLVPIRYGRMLASPFAFLRGSAALMAYDLSSTPVSGIRVQACGDCHLANLGLFATPERNLVFDLNDFDETLPAPWEWDIKRLAASFVVAGRYRGFSDDVNETAVLSLANSYRKHLNEYAQMHVLDVWYSRLDDQTLIESASNEGIREYRRKITNKARSSIAEYLFPRITQVKDGHLRIVDRPPLVFHVTDNSSQIEQIIKLLDIYHSTLPAHLCKLFSHYRFEDFAFKVVGVGSVGTRCFILLFMADHNDPLLLQAKEARRSVLEPYTKPSIFENQGERVVVGQRVMQSASDMFLGWLTTPEGTHYYIRQLRDMKFSVPIDVMDPVGMSNYAEVCGWVLARAHAKGGDAASLSGYLGKSDVFDQALAKFALAYADQNQKDYDRLVEAVKSGRLQVDLENQ
jgi:uncharacterized protein (DUF2252 family)